MDNSVTVEFEIQQILVLSTAHLPRVSALSMDNGEPLKYSYDTVSYGYILPVHGKEFDDEMPNWLKPIMCVARRIGASYVRFDCDGNKHDELIQYDW